MATVGAEIAVLSIREAAAYSGVSVMTLRRRIADGSLRARLVGNSFAIARADLDAFLATREQDRTTGQ